MGAAGQATGYEIDQSIRFNDDDSAHLSRTLGTASNRKIWTYSLWIKRANLGTRQQFWSVAVGGGSQGIIEFDLGDGGAGGNDQLVCNNETSGTTALNWELEIAFRDPAAWYNFVFVYDTTQSTTNDRFKCFVNGALQTEWDRNSTPGQNEEQAFNNALDHRIGEGHTAANYFDGYMAEIHFIDGTAKAASDFGETNDDGVWIPKKYDGAYGNNGFFIDGRDSSDLGDDESGNGNDFASSGLAAADQMSDSPTNNHCTLNSIQQDATGLSDGNLQFTTSSTSTHKTASGTIAATSGKYYCEVTCNATLGSNARIGIIPEDNDNYTGSDGHVGDDANSFAYVDNGQKESNNSQSSYGASYANGDVIAMALNLDDNEITFFKGGASQGAISITANTQYRFAASQFGSGGMAFNFGQAAFAATPPTGFKALNTANLPTPTISDGSKYFQTTLYTGNGSTQSINQSGENSTFQPDFVWIKGRGIAVDHALYDVVRGATKEIKSNATDAEATISNGVTAFESDGFALGDRIGVNSNTEPFVAWQWLAGNSSGSTNDDGSVDSTVTVNTTAGFSIVKWVHTTSANYTVGHGLGVTPKMILVKTLDRGTNWGVYHSDITVGNRLILNTTAAQGTGYWGANTWNSTVFSIGSIRDANSSNAIGYAFAEIPGYSSIGSFTGNGNADGPFVYTGFKPAFIIFKVSTNAPTGWIMLDNKRDTFNAVNHVLQPNSNDVENSGADFWDFLSNGFKVRNTWAAANGNGYTVTYMAFAEHPFGGDGIAPATAR